MSMEITFLCAILSLAMTLSALVTLLMRHMRAPLHARSAPDLPLPLTFRLTGPLTALLEPLAEALLPISRSTQTMKRLDRLGLSAAMSPAGWEASRAAHAAMSGAAVLLLPASHSLWFPVLAAGAGYALPALWLTRSLKRQSDHIMRELPGYLDLLTVAVEAGASLTSGIRMIVAEAPSSPLRNYFDRVLREVRGGRPRAAAFSHVAALYGIESLLTLASALAHAEASGMSLGQVLRTQAEQRTAERFARAEELAMQAPVKMLGPLILCIFPCTFIVLAVPIVARLREALGS